MLEKKTLKAVPHWDAADPKSAEPPLHFYMLEGECRKCKKGDNVLIIYDFKLNHKDKDQSIFKTQCLACGHKDMHYSASVQRE